MRQNRQTDKMGEERKPADGVEQYEGDNRMELINRTVDSEQCVYQIDELKYYEKINKSLRQIMISGWLFYKECPESVIKAEVECGGVIQTQGQTARSEEMQTTEAQQPEDLQIRTEVIGRQDVCDMYDGKNPQIGFRILISTKKQFQDICKEISVIVSRTDMGDEAGRSAAEEDCAVAPGEAEHRTDPVTVLTLPVNELEQYHVENVHYMIDQFALNGDVIRMAGWGYLSDLHEEYRPLTVWAEEPESGKVIGQAEYMMRPDIIDLFHSPEEKGRQWGFFLLLDMKDYPACEICFGEEKCKKTWHVDVEDLRRKKREKKRRYRSRFEMMRLADAKQKEDDRYYKKHLSKEAYDKILETRLQYKDVDYDVWMRRHLPSDKELARQRKTQFAENPKISIAVPAFRTPEKFLREMISSVQAQTYPNWELCIADGSLDGSITAVLEEYGKSDKRIKYVTLDDNYGISGNTNRALELATGDYISLLDHDDVITPDALYEVVKCINETGADCIYSDEDKVDYDLEDYFEPHFKPDFNLDMLRSCNYICHYFVVRKDVLQRAGLFQEEFDGSQDFDFILRCATEAKKVEHIRKMLYHWRCHAASTAMNPENKMYCYDAGKRAIAADLKRHGINGGTVENYTRLGYYKPVYPVTGDPKVTLFTRSESIEWLEQLQEQGMLYKNLELKVISEADWNCGAYQDIIANASGDYYLFADGILKDAGTGWIEMLLGNCQREEVGIVGALVYNELGRISSSGKIMDGNGRIRDLFEGLLKEEPGYAAHALMQQDVSVVSRKCFMISREDYEAAGGFFDFRSQTEEIYQMAMLCRKLSGQGKLVVYTPFVQVKEKQAPDTENVVIEELKTGQCDPNYSPAFDRDGEMFTLSL